MQNGVQIYVDQIVEIFQILRGKIQMKRKSKNKHYNVFTHLTGDRIASAVWVRKGVQKRVHRTFQQLYEWLFHRILSRAAEYRVLKDMWHAR